MLKSKCVHCVKGVVFDLKCKKVVSHYYCDIDADDTADGCSEGYCNYYKRKKESEIKDAD